RPVPPMGCPPGRDAGRNHKSKGAELLDFVAKKLKYLVQGLSPANAALKARRSIDKIPSKCLVIVTKDASRVVLPDVGKQLDAAVPPIPLLPAQPVDTTTLPDALVTLLETWVDRVGPNAAPLKPNIVLILTDDQRFDTIDTTHSIDGGRTEPEDVYLLPLVPSRAAVASYTAVQNPRA